MKYINKVIELFIISFISTIVLSIFSYNNIIKEDFVSVIQLFILFSTIFIISYNLGKTKQKDGYLEGIKFGGIIVILFLILNILFVKDLNISKLIYYILMVVLSIIGSILVINKKIKA